MTDTVSKAVRSRIMSRIRGKDTRPEMVVRGNLHRLGLRYRLHDRSLPGTPDLVFPQYKTVVMVNGCWWHQHDCGRFRPPKSNLGFWGPKLERNRENTVKKLAALKALGWRVVEVWECQLKGMDWPGLAAMIRDRSVVPQESRRADLDEYDLGDL